MGFEPTRAEPIGLAVQRLNHSATSSCTFPFVFNDSVTPIFLCLSSNRRPKVSLMIGGLNYFQKLTKRQITFCWIFCSCHKLNLRCEGDEEEAESAQHTGDTRQARDGSVFGSLFRILLSSLLLSPAFAWLSLFSSWFILNSSTQLSSKDRFYCRARWLTPRRLEGLFVQASVGNIPFIKWPNTRRERTHSKLKEREDTIENKEDMEDKPNPSSRRRPRQPRRSSWGWNVPSVSIDISCPSRDANISKSEERRSERDRWSSFRMICNRSPSVLFTNVSASPLNPNLKLNSSFVSHCLHTKTTGRIPG